MVSRGRPSRIPACSNQSIRSIQGWSFASNLMNTQRADLEVFHPTKMEAEQSGTFLSIYRLKALRISHGFWMLYSAASTDGSDIGGSRDVRGRKPEDRKRDGALCLCFGRMIRWKIRLTRFFSLRLVPGTKRTLPTLHICVLRLQSTSSGKQMIPRTIVQLSDAPPGEIAV